MADHRTPQGGTCLREAWPTATARHRQHERDFAAGVHPKAIQERLEHGLISIALDRYWHLMDGLDKGAADKLDRTCTNGMLALRLFFGPAHD